MNALLGAISDAPRDSGSWSARTRHYISWNNTCMHCSPHGQQVLVPRVQEPQRCAVLSSLHQACGWQQPAMALTRC